MCQYRSYTHTCCHGTPTKPAYNLTSTCTNPTTPGLICSTPTILNSPIATGFPCWSCHQERMVELSMRANIWKYMMILERLCGEGEMMPELKRYRALMNAVQNYGVSAVGGGGEMDSEGYWNEGIGELARMVGIGGVSVAEEVEKVQAGRGAEDSVVGGFRFEGECWEEFEVGRVADDVPSEDEVWEW